MLQFKNGKLVLVKHKPVHVLAGPISDGPVAHPVGQSMMTPLQIRLIGLLVVLLLLANYCWLYVDRKPFAWDESIHYLGAMGYYQAWLGQGLQGLRHFFTQSDFYPPLTEWLTGLIFRLTGPRPDTASFLNLFYLTAILGLLISLGRRWKSMDAAIMAGYLFLTSALVSLQSKLFMLDIPLTFYVLLAVWSFDRSRHFRKRSWSLVYGLAFGLAMLTKWSALFFLALPPVISVVITSWKTSKHRGDRWLNLTLAYTVALVIAFPWYALHLIKLVKNTSGYLYERGALENDPSLATVQAWLYYPLAILRQLSLPAGLLALGGFGWALVKKKAVMPAWLWVILPCLILTLIRSKDTHYTMPLLPVCGLIALLWIQGLRQELRARLMVVMAVLLSGQMIYSHLGTYAGPIYRMFNHTWEGLPVVESQAPDHRHWPLTEILADVEQAGRALGRTPLLRVIPGAASFSRVTFAVEQARHPYNVQLSSITNWPAFTDFAVTKTGSLGLPFLIKNQTAITEALFNTTSAEARVFQLIRQYKLPDGSQARLYQRVAQPLPELEAPAVMTMLHQHLEGLLEDYIHNAKDLSITVESYDSGQTRLGRFKSIRISAGQGLVGDFKRQALAVPFNKIDVILEDVTLDLKALTSGRLLPYALKSLEVKNLTMEANALNNTLAAAQGELRQCRVSMDQGRLRLRYLGKYPLEVTLGLQVQTDLHDQRSDNLYAHLLEIATSWGRLPAGVVQLILNDFNPLLKLSGFPVSVRLGKCRISPQQLLIGTSVAEPGQTGQP